MLSGRFDFFKKNVGQSKNKSVKNAMIKSVSDESLSSISILYFRDLMVLALHCYYGDNVKYGLLLKHLFRRKQQYGS